MEIAHGDSRSYRAHGCRCDDCRKAQTLMVRRERVKRILGRTVPWVDAARPMSETREMVELGFSRNRIARMSGVDRRCVQRLVQGEHYVLASSAAKIHSLWLDVCGPVAKDNRRFPAEPLIAAVIAHYGSVTATGTAARAALRRFRRKGTLSEEQADGWAMRLLGKTRYEIWGEVA